MVDTNVIVNIAADSSGLSKGAGGAISEITKLRSATQKLSGSLDNATSESDAFARRLSKIQTAARALLLSFRVSEFIESLSGNFDQASRLITNNFNVLTKSSNTFIESLNGFSVFPAIGDLVEKSLSRIQTVLVSLGKSLRNIDFSEFLNAISNLSGTPFRAIRNGFDQISASVNSLIENSNFSNIFEQSLSQVSNLSRVAKGDIDNLSQVLSDIPAQNVLRLSSGFDNLSNSIQIANTNSAILRSTLTQSVSTGFANQANLAFNNVAESASLSLVQTELFQNALAKGAGTAAIEINNLRLSSQVLSNSFTDAIITSEVFNENLVRLQAGTQGLFSSFKSSEPEIVKTNLAIIDLSDTFKRATDESDVLSRSLVRIQTAASQFNTSNFDIIDAEIIADPLLETENVFARVTASANNFSKSFTEALDNAGISLGGLLKEVASFVDKTTTQILSFRIIAETFTEVTARATGLVNTLRLFEELNLDTSGFQNLIRLAQSFTLNTESANNFVIAATAAAVDLEDQVNKVLTLFTDLNESQQQIKFEEIRSAITQVTSDLGNSITAIEATQAAYQTFSAFPEFTTDVDGVTKALSVITPGLELSAASGGRADIVLKALAQTMKAYGIETDQAAEAAGKLFTVQLQGINEVPEFADRFGRLAGVAAQLQIDFDELLGTFAGLTQVTDVDTALTGLLSLFNQIASESGLAAKSTLEELQVEFDANSVASRGLVASLELLNEATAGDGELLNRIIPDRLAYQTALLATGKAADGVTASIEALGEAGAEDLENAFGTRTQGFLNTSGSLLDGFNDILADFGTRFLERFSFTLGFFESLLQVLQNLPDPLKEAIAGFLLIQSTIQQAGSAVVSLIGGFLKLVITYATLNAAAVIFSGAVIDNFKALQAAQFSVQAIITFLARLVGLQASVTATTNAATGAVNANTAANNSNASSSQLLTIAKLALSKVTEGLSVVYGVLTTRFLFFDTAVKAITTSLITFSVSQTALLNSAKLLAAAIGVVVVAFGGFTALQNENIRNLGILSAVVVGLSIAFLSFKDVVQLLLVNYTAFTIVIGSSTGLFGLATTAAISLATGIQAIGAAIAAAFSSGLVAIIAAFLTVLVSLVAVIQTVRFAIERFEIASLTSDLIELSDRLDLSTKEFQKFREGAVSSTSSLERLGLFIEDLVRGIPGLEQLGSILNDLITGERDFQLAPLFEEATDNIVELNQELTSFDRLLRASIENSEALDSSVFEQTFDQLTNRIEFLRQQQEALESAASETRDSSALQTLNILIGQTEAAASSYEKLRNQLLENQTALSGIIPTTIGAANAGDALRASITGAAQAFEDTGTFEASEDYFGLITEGYEQGVTSADEYLEALRRIADQVTLDNDSQADGIEGIQLRLDALNRAAEVEAEILRNQSTQFERLQQERLTIIAESVAAEEITAEEAAQKRFEIEQKALDQRISLLTSKRDELVEASQGISPEEIKNNQDEIDKIESQLFELRTERANQITEQRQQALEQELADFDRNAQNRREVADQVTADLINLQKQLQAENIQTEQETQDSIAAIRRQASEQQIAAIENEIAAIDDLFSRSLINEEQAAERRLRLTSELQSAQSKYYDQLIDDQDRSIEKIEEEINLQLELSQIARNQDIRQQEQKLDLLDQGIEKLQSEFDLQEQIQRTEQARIDSTIKLTELESENIQNQIESNRVLIESANSQITRNRLSQETLDLERQQTALLIQRQSDEKRLLEDQQQFRLNEIALEKALEKAGLRRLEIENRIAALQTEGAISELNAELQILEAKNLLTEADEVQLLGLQNQLEAQSDILENLNNQEKVFSDIENNIEQVVQESKERLNLENEVAKAQLETQQEQELISSILEGINAEGRSQVSIANEIQELYSQGAGGLELQRDRALALAQGLLAAGDAQSRLNSLQSEGGRDGQDPTDRGSGLSADSQFEVANAFELSGTIIEGGEVGSNFGNLENIIALTRDLANIENTRSLELERQLELGEFQLEQYREQLISLQDLVFATGVPAGEAQKAIRLLTQPLIEIQSAVKELVAEIEQQLILQRDIIEPLTAEKNLRSEIINTINADTSVFRLQLEIANERLQTAEAEGVTGQELLDLTKERINLEFDLANAQAKSQRQDLLIQQADLRIKLATAEADEQAKIAVEIQKQIGSVNEQLRLLQVQSELRDTARQEQLESAEQEILNGQEILEVENRQLETQLDQVEVTELQDEALDNLLDNEREILSIQDQKIEKLDQQIARQQGIAQLIESENELRLIGLEAEESAITRSIELTEARNELNQLQNQSQIQFLESELDLLQQGIDLQEALNTLQDPELRQQIQNEIADERIDQIESEFDALLRQQDLEDEIAEARLDSLQEEQQEQRELLDLEIERDRIALERDRRQQEAAIERARTELRIAQLELNQAQASGEGIEQAELQVDLAQTELQLQQETFDILLDEISLQENLFGIQQSTLQQELRQQLAEENTNELIREREQLLEQAQLLAEQETRELELRLEKQEQALDLQEKSLSNQENLLSAQSDLANAQSDARISALETELDIFDQALELQEALNSTDDLQIRNQIQRELREIGLRFSDDELENLQDRQEIEDKIAQAKLESLIQEQQLEQQLLELQIQRDRLALESEKRRQKSTIEQLELELKLASTAEERAIIGSQLALERNELNAINDEIRIQSQIFAIEQDILNTQQEQVFNEALIQDQIREREQLLEQAALAAELAADGIETTGISNDSIEAPEFEPGPSIQLAPDFTAVAEAQSDIEETSEIIIPLFARQKDLASESLEVERERVEVANQFKDIVFQTVDALELRNSTSQGIDAAIEDNIQVQIDSSFTDPLQDLARTQDEFKRLNFNVNPVKIDSNDLPDINSNTIQMIDLIQQAILELQSSNRRSQRVSVVDLNQNSGSILSQVGL